MKEILLINSPLYKSGMDNNDEDTLPSLGLVYIASYLKEKNVRVKLIDAIKFRLSTKQLIGIINEHSYKYIGLNIFSTNYSLVKEVVEGVLIPTNFIIGGLATKELYPQILEWNTENNIDIVIGDGEFITYDIITNNLKEAPISFNSMRRVFKVFEKSNYYIKDISNLPLDRKLLVNDPILNFHGVLESNIVTSRGCIYNCSFCAAAKSQNIQSRIRERNKESIIHELEFIKNQYPEVKSIRVLDDLFLKSNHNLMNAIDIFSGFKFTWRSMACINTFYTLNQKDIDDLHKCGCSEIFTGIESGSKRILKSLNKKIDRNITLTTLEKLFRAGIDVKGYFIYGFPFERSEDMEMTYNLAYESKVLANKLRSNFRVSVFQFRPYHGTELYKRLVEKNIPIANILPNEELNRIIGRDLYNFSSGNYSAVEDSVLLDYIRKTNALNGSSKIFRRLFNTKSKQKQEM
jgi:anaerobic magnesium-protoporphyrin IX monomethyl ester cyclase